MTTTPKKAKRELFGSIVSSTPSSSSSSSVPDFIAFVAIVDLPRKSESSLNEYFDVHVQTDGSMLDIRVMVMKATNYPRSFFLKKKETGEALKFKNTTKAANGIIFINKNSDVTVALNHEVTFEYKGVKDGKVNQVVDIIKHKEGTFNIAGRVTFQGELRSPSKCKQAVQDAVFCDGSGSIMISIWGEKVKEIISGEFYELKYVKIRNFNGKCLSTMSFTEIRKIPEFAVKEPKEVLKTKICCPNVENVEVNIYPVSTNVQCKKKTGALTTNIITCHACKRKMLLKKAHASLHVIAQLEANDQRKTVTIFEAQLVDAFGEECVKAGYSE